MNLDEKLTPNFSIGEMIRSRTASKKGIDNTPTQEHLDNLRKTCVALQLARAKLGNRSMKVTSGYRGTLLNTEIGGAAASYHCFGLAADVKVKGVPLIEVARAFAQIPLIDKVIYETLDGRKWVHIQISKDCDVPRQQWFIANHRNEAGRVVYERTESDFITPYEYK